MMENQIIDSAVYFGLKDSVGAEFMVELVDTYLADAPAQITAMREALTAADAERFRRAAHSLKSASLNFGAVALADQARALEKLGHDNRLQDVGDMLQTIDRLFSLVSDELKRLINE